MEKDPLGLWASGAPPGSRSPETGTLSLGEAPGKACNAQKPLGRDVATKIPLGQGTRVGAMNSVMRDTLLDRRERKI